jgi:NAD(P)-dependent dehydrogenase (short-subunit alcohol dehydrogenase family)
MDIMKKTVLVTGVTGAIGKATAIELAKNNCKVILLARNEEKLKAAEAEIKKISGNNDIDHVIADLSEIKSVKNAVEEIKKKTSSLDALVNVAAIYKKQHTLNSKGLEHTFVTNHLAPFALTEGLLPLIKSSKGRVVTVSAPSTTKVNFDDLQSRKKYSAGFLGSFGATKMMNILFTYALARRLEGSGASAMVFHPGLVKSDLTRDMPALMNFIFKSMSAAPDKAAKMLSDLAINEKYQDNNGKFFKFDGKQIKSSGYSYDKEVQEKLWKVSEELSMA